MNLIKNMLGKKKKVKKTTKAQHQEKHQETQQQKQSITINGMEITWKGSKAPQITISGGDIKVQP